MDCVLGQTGGQFTNKSSRGFIVAVSISSMILTVIRVFMSCRITDSSPFSDCLRGKEEWRLLDVLDWCVAGSVCLYAK